MAIPFRTENRAMSDHSQTHDLRVVVAGQIPPPLGGQNICIKRTLDLLKADERFCCEHLVFEFTKTWEAARMVNGGKLIELFKVIGRLLSLRLVGKIDVLIYPVGGPHLVAILRDMLLLPFARLCSRRVLLHFHAAGLAEFLVKQKTWQKKVVQFMYASCCHEAIVNADFGRNDAKAVGIHEIHTLPNAVEDHAKGLFIRNKKDACEILNVGHLCRDKGTPQLIEAFSRIASAWPELHLKLVGEPLAPYTRENLLGDIEKSGFQDRISWMGVLQGHPLQEAFRDADLFVFSSVAPYESFGLVMVEAMQWSLPLIITDWRANREVCGPFFGGVIAEDPDKDLESSLVTAIDRALSTHEDWAKWGETNRMIFETNYAMSVFSFRLVNIMMVD